MSAKCLLGHITSTKIENFFLLPPFAVLNLQKWIKKLPVTMDFDLIAHINSEYNFLD